jgi:hypothetical protein
VNYITPMDRPHIIRPGEVVFFSRRDCGGRWATIVAVDPILPGVVSQNFAGRDEVAMPVARIVVHTQDGAELSGTDLDICGWLVPETGAMTIHDARICLPA